MIGTLGAQDMSMTRDALRRDKEQAGVPGSTGRRR